MLDDLEAWLAAQLPALSAKTPLATAIRHALARLPRLRPYLEHGTLEADNNAAERAMRAIALGRKNSHDRRQVYAHRPSSARHPAETWKVLTDGLVQGAEVSATVAQTLIRGSACGPMMVMRRGGWPQSSCGGPVG